MPAALDQRDLKRRHPLCPSCGYDLVATIAANKRICPECGQAFELSDLDFERRVGDWNTLTALRFAGRTLLIRGAFGVLVAIALSAAAIWLAKINAPRPLPLSAGIVQACLLGAIFSRNLFEHAGFESIALIVAACLAAAIVTGMGWLVAMQWIIAPQSPAIGLLHMITSLVGAFAWIIHQLALESA